MTAKELVKRYNAQKDPLGVSEEMAQTYLDTEVVPGDTERDIVDGFTSFVWLTIFG